MGEERKKMKGTAKSYYSLLTSHFSESDLYLLTPHLHALFQTLDFLLFDPLPHFTWSWFNATSPVGQNSETNSTKGRTTDALGLDSFNVRIIESHHNNLTFSFPLTIYSWPSTP